MVNSVDVPADREAYLFGLAAAKLATRTAADDGGRLVLLWNRRAITITRFSIGDRIG